MPDSGRTSLYLGAHVTHIVGWPRDDSDRFIAAINSHIAKPEFRYRHQWRVGDLLVWDNRSLVHRAKHAVKPEPTASFRVTVHDEHPFYEGFVAP